MSQGAHPASDERTEALTRLHAVAEWLATNVADSSLSQDDDEPHVEPFDPRKTDRGELNG